MDPLWKVVTSKPITDEQAAAILREFVKKVPKERESQGGRNVSKDIKKLQRSVQAMAAWKKENEES